MQLRSGPIGPASHNVNSHMSKHKSVNRFQCKLCYKTFKKKQTELLHTERLHKDEAEFLNREITDADLLYPCMKCDLKFVSQRLLSSHKELAHSQEQTFYNIKTKTYNCPLCHSQSKTGQKLNNHLRQFHSSDLNLLGSIKEEDYTVPCNLCDLKFVKETHLDLHRIRFHFPSDKKVPCDRCQHSDL